MKNEKDISINLVENVDYKIRMDMKEDPVPFEILKGPFAGIVYQYDKVQPFEINDDSSMDITVDFHVLNHSSDIENIEEFKEVIGQVLLSVILKEIEEKVKDEYDGETDITELDS